MFNSARLKLTSWYSLIILSISLTFSLVIYALVNRDLRRIESNHRAWLERQRLVMRFQPEVIATYLEGTEAVALARRSLVLNLVVANAVIVALAASAGYFLAGRTLRPIQQSLDDQTRFVADASHELRTPITSLRAQLEVSLRNLKLTLPESKNILSSLLEDVINLQHLSDNLIALARRQEQTPITLSPASVTEIVAASLKRISPQAQAKQIGIDITGVTNTSLTADSKSLVEALVILADNAIKYSPPKSTVTIASSSSRGFVNISVTDTGPGIPKKDLPHLFDRFYRGDKSRTSEGFGLGLSIAKKITDLHHGEIKIDTAPNTGSTFTLKLPL